MCIVPILISKVEKRANRGNSESSESSIDCASDRCDSCLLFFFTFQDHLRKNLMKSILGILFLKAFIRGCKKPSHDETNKQQEHPCHHGDSINVATRHPIAVLQNVDGHFLSFRLFFFFNSLATCYFILIKMRRRQKQLCKA